MCGIRSQRSGRSTKLVARAAATASASPGAISASAAVVASLPRAPFAAGQLEEDLLAGLEVTQQRRLVDADGAGDLRERHRADAVAAGQVGGRGEDRLAALLLLLGAPGALEGLGCHATSSRT